MAGQTPRAKNEAGTMIKPNSDEEWELEQRTFRAANHQTVPEWARDLIKDLWRELCAREPINS